MAALKMEDVINIEDLEAKCPLAQPVNGQTQIAYSYFKMAAEDEFTANENVEAWKRVILRPRVLVNVDNVDPSTTILGNRVASPIMIAPVSLLSWVHPEGELAVARATCKTHHVFCLSCSSSIPLEDVAAAHSAAESKNSVPLGSPRWFQLYVFKDRQLTSTLIQRAEASGFSALVITVDHAVLGNRESCQRVHGASFKFPPDLFMANFSPKSSAEKASESAKAASTLPASFAAYVTSLYDQTLDWHTIDWVRSITKLPIILKGIVTAADAELAVQHGAAAIVVSNHGGRQLNGTCGTATALPEVIAATRGRVEVYIDGGIRRGADVFRALALGAKAVLIGRPMVWGLNYGGEAGVTRALDILRQELRVVMALCGCRTVDAITPAHAVPPPSYTAHWPPARSTSPSHPFGGWLFFGLILAATLLSKWSSPRSR